MHKSKPSKASEEPRSTLVYPLSDKEQKQAIAEGWDIFLFETESGELIHRLEKHDEAGVLQSDFAAWVIVYEGQAKGNELHTKVWEFIKEHSPSEFEEINKSIWLHHHKAS